MTTIIGKRAALGKRLSPFNGANAADPDKRREGEKRYIYIYINAGLR